jgi:hypothetical protein
VFGKDATNAANQSRETAISPGNVGSLSPKWTFFLFTRAARPEAASSPSFRTRIDSLTSRAIALVKNGVAKDRLMAELRTDDLGWRLSLAGEALDRFYSELSQVK